MQYTRDILSINIPCYSYQNLKIRRVSVAYVAPQKPNNPLPRGTHLDFHHTWHIRRIHYKLQRFFGHCHVRVSGSPWLRLQLLQLLSSFLLRSNSMLRRITPLRSGFLSSIAVSTVAESPLRFPFPIRTCEPALAISLHLFSLR